MILASGQGACIYDADSHLLFQCVYWERQGLYPQAAAAAAGEG